jgi:luciferase family oxidoreductase group 1
MAELSFLDIVPMLDNGTVSDAMARAARIAHLCDELGYRRYWVAEHHAMPGIASAATSVVLAHCGAHTRRIRIGAGGIMLPNHAPLQIAEQFGTLDALFPGRVDLGLGRAPGAEQHVARALRRGLGAHPDSYPRDVVELQNFFAGADETGVLAMPGAGANPELWILGSSTYGAQLAALLGLPYGFASHFSPQALDDALHIYRTSFRPSKALAAPRVMVAMNVIAADSDDEAHLLATSYQHAYGALRRGEPLVGLKPAMPELVIPRGERPLPGRQLGTGLAAVGAVETVREGMAWLLERTRADELVIASQVWDHDARERSIRLAMEAMASLAERQRAPTVSG